MLDLVQGDLVLLCSSGFKAFLDGGLGGGLLGDLDLEADGVLGGLHVKVGKNKVQCDLIKL